MDPAKALPHAQKCLDHVRSTLNDQWNFHGLNSGPGYGLDGLPWCTSHYTFHMVLWHIPFALSGQFFSAPEAILSFDPKMSLPFKIPFFTPDAIGILKAREEKDKKGLRKKFEIVSTSGSLRLKTLMVSGVKYPKSAVELKEGRSVTWFSR